MLQKQQSCAIFVDNQWKRAKKVHRTETFSDDCFGTLYLFHIAYLVDYKYFAAMLLCVT